ncbi:MAG: ATPase [Alphaproteobacteria bacterium]|nr:ATPase [Alphaproteobacteria bacterium]
MRKRRFFKKVEVAEVEEGFAIHLDGRPVRTPGRARLILSSKRLADAVAAEWRGQGETIRPHTMPLTQLANTAIDRIGPLRQAVIDEVMKYAGTDLLCYRVQEPVALALRQSTRWQPVLDWAAERFGAKLVVTAGILPVAQPAPALAALREKLDSYDTLRLAVAQSVVAASGSLVLALALVEGYLDAEATFAASQLDELWQNELWGEDELALKRRETLKAEIFAAADFLAFATT